MGTYFGRFGVFRSGDGFCGGTKLLCGGGTPFGGINSVTYGNRLDSELSTGKFIFDLN